MWALSLDRLDLYASQREDNKTTRMRRRPPLLVLLLFLGAALLWWCSLSLTTLSPDRSHSPSHLAVAEGALPLESKEALSAPVQPRAEVSVPVQLAPIGGEGGFWLPPSETGGAAASAHNAGAGQVHEVCISRPGRAEEQRALSLLPRPSSASCTATAPQSASPKSSARGGASEGSAAGFACAVAASASEVIILAAGAGTRSEALRKRLLAARDVLSGPPSQPRAPKRVLLITGDVDVEALATSLGIAWIADAALTGVVRTIGGGGGGGGGGGDGGGGALSTEPTPTVAQWRLAAMLLRRGCRVAVSGAAVLWHASPFAHATADVDVQAAQLGGSDGRGSVIGVHDPPMGWSAYGQTSTRNAASSDKRPLLLGPTALAARTDGPRCSDPRPLLLGPTALAARTNGPCCSDKRPLLVDMSAAWLTKAHMSAPFRLCA